MSDKERQEYDQARQWSRMGWGSINSGDTQAKRDGHLAGLVERQNDLQRVEIKRLERQRAEAEREALLQTVARERDEQLERETREDEEREERRWQTAADVDERRLEALRYDTLLLGQKVAACTANPVEESAFWFARDEVARLVRKTSKGDEELPGIDDPLKLKSFLGL